jgi:aminoglycoside phosphotransferase (APT) family kinase protein
MPEPEGTTQAARQLLAVLTDKAVEVYGSSAKVESLRRLSGGASRETWSFDVSIAGGKSIPLILKRDPITYLPDGTFHSENPDDIPLGVDRATEGRLMALAGSVGVPAPEVPFFLAEDARTSAGFVMQRLEGETLGRRILRDEALADARKKLAFQCGHAAARLHTLPAEDLPELQSMDARQQVDFFRREMHAVDHPYPGFEYGFRWLEERLELAGASHTLVHGDFRNGNILVGPDGLRGVLDWELAHLGNPLNDLGWICVRSWRFGHFRKPVGGFGEIEDLIAGYGAGGGENVRTEALHYWEVFGTLRWGILCISMAFGHINGKYSSLEKAAVGRRTAETEYDLLQLID